MRGIWEAKCEEVNMSCKSLGCKDIKWFNKIHLQLKQWYNEKIYLWDLNGPCTVQHHVVPED